MDSEARNTCTHTEPHSMASESSDGFVDSGIPGVIENDSLDFDEWVSLISAIERSDPNDMEKISLLYDSFLSKFPLCYGYWRKYAAHVTRLSTIERVIEIFEQAVQSATYVVNVWVDYCSFSMLAFEDPSDIRRLFRRGIYFVGKDYLCHALWDKYIEFELSQQNWSSLTLLSIETLQFPTKKLHQYYESFKKLVAHIEEDFSSQASTSMEIQPDHFQDEVPMQLKEDKISAVIKDLLDASDNCTRSKALIKYKIMGERYYQNACQLDKKISRFEGHIRRSYFHVKPLDATQLNNWHHYLDFAEARGDFDWVVKLYERCLIPCAKYPEYWLRYADFMEAKGGREIANLALHRASEIYLKRMPAIHLFNALFKEQIGDLNAARAAIISSEEEIDAAFIKSVIRRANMEKRLGNTVEAFNILKNALYQAELKEKSQNGSLLYIHFSRLKYMITNDIEATRDILVEGIRKFPHCKELIKFSVMHGGSKHIDVLDSVVADAISSVPSKCPRLKEGDAEDISTLYLEFVDLCGTIHDIRKAWNRHLKLFPDTIRTYAEKNLLRSTSPRFPKQKIEDCPATRPPHPSAYFSCEGQALGGEIASAPADTNKNSGLVSGDHCAQLQLQIKKTDECSRERPLSPQVSETASGEAPEGNVEFVQKKVRTELPAERLVSLSNSEDDISDKIKNVQPSLGTASKDVRTQRKCERDSQKGANPFSLENFSLDFRDELSADTVPSSSRACETPLETCKSDRSTPDSPYYRHQDWSVSESGLKHSGVKTSGNRQSTKSTNDSQHWRQRNNTDRPHRGSRLPFHSHSYRKHHHRRVSQRWKQGEDGAPKLSTAGSSSLPQPMQNCQMKQPSQSQYQREGKTSNNQVAYQGWSAQMLQQNLPSLPEPPVQPVMPQAHEHSVQASGLCGQMQNTEAYSQMWQYYYYQQQQFLLQQQQHQLPQQSLHQQGKLQQQPLQQQQYVQSEQQSFQLEQVRQHQNQQGNVYQQRHAQFQELALQQQQLVQPQQQQDIPCVQNQTQLQQNQPMQPQTQGQEELELTWQKQGATPTDCQLLNGSGTPQVEGMTVPKESGSTAFVAASATSHSSDKSPQE